MVQWVCEQVQREIPAHLGQGGSHTTWRPLATVMNSSQFLVAMGMERYGALPVQVLELSVAALCTDFRSPYVNDSGLHIRSRAFRTPVFSDAVHQPETLAALASNLHSSTLKKESWIHPYFQCFFPFFLQVLYAPQILLLDRLFS